ncbi:unnamed protein product [Paramecium octaurelia]|uniref:Rab-GAP TBC domain-containing protein n=1 Tax=Paramecium octaurelia TaxID=43137 RepID=A0A8S1UNV3_PAROT|nr:unnamed protein product [Paramecium octaurelia]
MKQSTKKERRGSIDSQLSSSIFKSNFLAIDIKKQIDDEQVNYQGDDELAISEKQPKYQPIPLLNNEQLIKLSKKKNLGDEEKLQIAATLIQQRGLKFLQRRAIWMNFIEKGDAKKYFQKQPPQNVQQQISKDLNRSGHDDKMKTNKFTHILSRILGAYAIYNPKIGYTQGMNIICGNIILLLSIDGNDTQLELDNFEVIEDEEEMFWMFVHLMKSMENLFISGVPGIHSRIAELELMLQSRCNEILLHLQSNNINNLCQCFSQYYFTMLMQKQDKKFVRLILEMYLLYGESFIQNFIVGTLQFYQLKITNMNELEKLMPFFRDTMFASYYQELKKLKKQNLIIQHFQSNHYFDKVPYLGNSSNQPIVEKKGKKQQFQEKILNLLSKNWLKKFLGQ